MLISYKLIHWIYNQHLQTV